jgi:hypothetical protein
MKDLIFITAFCNSEEQEQKLEKCLDSVLKSGMHVAIISHSHVPVHLQKKCHYYFYDYLNETSDDPELLGFQGYYFSLGSIQSRFFNKYFYGFAIYRMFCIASQIGINFGYDNIHHVEYDLEVLDPTIFHENSEHLKEYDSVIYTGTGDEKGFLFGSLKSFKVKSLPENFKNYNRSFLDTTMRVTEAKQLENLTKELFINSGKVLFKPFPTERYFKSKNFYSRNVHYTLFHNSQDESLNIFWKSPKESTENVVVIVNKKNVVNIEIKPLHWHIESLGKFDEIQHVRIDNSNQILYEQSFDQELRDFYKINSYIALNEKDN